LSIVSGETTATAPPHRNPLPCLLCGKQQLIKLSQHLKQTHKITPKAERDKLIIEARKVGKN